MKKQSSKETRYALPDISSEDAGIIKWTALQLGIKDTDVLRKGLKFIDLYARTKADHPNLKVIFETEETRQEIII